MIARAVRRAALALEYHLFKKQGALLRRVISPPLQANLRRKIRAVYLLWEARQYRAWMIQRVQRRQSLYPQPVEPDLFSILTPVWNGSPLKYLQVLANSVIAQNESGSAEWVILDNGCTEPNLLAYLEALRKYPWISIHRSNENIGIIRGLQLCLERARGRYVLPADSDDLLYPDCLRVVSAYVREAGYPALLYTDEDKVIGSRSLQPYFKPDFDPVLLLNSAYIAHLGVIHRETALQLGAYSDPKTEGSADWDLFVRFLVAGHAPVHIPEVVYSWRMHPASTADDAASKPYIHSSQKAVLQRFLDDTSRSNQYSVEYSPLLGKSADWWFRPRQLLPRPILLVMLFTESVAGADRGSAENVDYPQFRTVSLSIGSPVESLLTFADELADGDGFICLLSHDVEVDRSDWAWEVIGVTEMHPDTVMVGGRIRSSKGFITSAGYCFGFAGPCGCPDRGRPAIDPGYFTQMLKQHSVSAVSTQFAAIRGTFLRDLLRQGVHSSASIPFLGAWAGAYALRTGKRVVYSPMLGGVSDTDWDALAGSTEKETFREKYSDLIPDHRFYPRYFGLEPSSAYQVVAGT